VIDTPSQPTNRDEMEQVEYGQHVIFRLLGSTIAAFGSNERGEIFFAAVKNGERTEFVIGKDEAGELELFEVEPVPAALT